MKFYFWLAFRMMFSRQILFGGSAPLSFLGLILGVASLVASMAVMSGYEETLKQAMTDVTSDIQIVRRGKLVEEWGVFSAKLKKIEPRIQHMARFGNAEAVLAKNGQVSGVLFQGIESHEMNKVMSVEHRIKAGTMRLDDDSIAIGQGLARKFKLRVDDTVYVVVPLPTPFESSGFRRQSKEFKISAVLDLGKNDWNDRLIIGDLKALQKLTDIGDRYTGAFVKLDNRDQTTSATMNLLTHLSTDFSVMDWYEVNRNLFEAVRIERAVIFFVVLIIIIVAAFNISSTLYVFIRQKYSDIAILKTLGLSPKKIQNLFICQGLIVGFAGLVLGLLAGWLLCVGFMVLQNYFSLISGSVYKLDRIDADIRGIDVIVIACSTIVICLLATVAPARKGSRLEVIEGLKNG